MPSDRNGLPCAAIADNILHNNGPFGSKCNTCSEVHSGNIPFTEPTPRLPLCPNPMLDDPAAGRRNGLLHSIGSTLSKRGGLLQQLHPQRRLVHPSVHSSIRKKRALVLSRYRLLPCRDPNQNAHCADHEKPGRDERRDAPGDTPMPLPWGPGEPLAQRQHPAAENRPLPGLLCFRSAQSGEPASGIGYSTNKGGTVFSRDSHPDSGRVYPQSRFQLRAIGQNNLQKQERDRECQTDRTAFRSTRSKKRMRVARFHPPSFPRPRHPGPP